MAEILKDMTYVAFHILCMIISPGRFYHPKKFQFNSTSAPVNGYKTRVQKLVAKYFILFLENSDMILPSLYPHFLCFFFPSSHSAY